MTKGHSITLFALLSLFACGTGENGTAQDTTGTATEMAPLPEQTEDDWREPDVILSTVAIPPSSTVANVYAGDGFYAFMLVKNGNRVIATDPDPDNVSKMNARKKKDGITDDKLEVRLAENGSTGLKPNEADMGFVAYSFLAIPDRARFFQEVRAALREPKPVVIIDFNPTPSPVGPPMEMRISDREVMEQLDQYGFTDVGSYSKKLPYQWLMVAQDFMEMPGDGE